MDHSATASNINAGTFFFNAYGCWLKNVRDVNSKEKHVWMYQSAHLTVRDSYFYGTQNAASESYGTDQFSSSDNLIENNIFQHITAPMMGGLDKSFYLLKCPAHALSLSTCQGRTGNTDTVLLVNRGSMRVANGVCTAVAPPIGREIACNDERPANCAANPNNTHTSEILSAGGGERGIFTITVDTHPIVGASGNASFETAARP